MLGCIRIRTRKMGYIVNHVRDGCSSITSFR